MEVKRGRYLRPDELIDDELIDIGVKFTDRTLETPRDAEFDVEEAGGLFTSLKMTVIFFALTIGIGVCEHLGLMEEIIAVPGMCVCAACTGWNARCK